MIHPIGASLVGDLALAAPLVLAVSFVYAGTRHEHIGPILRHGVKLTLMLTGIMALGFGLLWLAS